jgi:hypothetical protein
VTVEAPKRKEKKNNKRRWRTKQNKTKKKILRFVKLGFERIDKKVDYGLVARFADDTFLLHIMLRAEQSLVGIQIKHTVGKISLARRARKTTRMHISEIRRKKQRRKLKPQTANCSSY